MNAYQTMKEKHQEEFNEFPMVFAFGQKQFDEAMQKLGLKPTETDKICSFGNTGGFYRKDDAHQLHEMFKRQDEERCQALVSDENFAFDMFYYELGNHEYSYTNDVTDTLNALGLTMNEVLENKNLARALDKACKALKDQDAFNR